MVKEHPRKGEWPASRIMPEAVAWVQAWLREGPADLRTDSLRQNRPVLRTRASIAAPLSLLQTMLGIQPNAIERSLVLDHPQLPDWLGRVRLRNLRVGSARVDILVEQRGGVTSAEVTRTEGELAVTVLTS